MKATVTCDIDITVPMLAKMFSELDDDQQAQFFVEVAKIGAEWWHQWYAVGKHLRTCECSTEEARDVVRTIHEGMVAK